MQLISLFSHHIGKTLDHGTHKYNIQEKTEEEGRAM